MPTLTIRNLPEPVHAALRLLAARDGISVEAEVRAILGNACMIDKAPASALLEWVDRHYPGKKPEHVVDDLLQERRAEAAKE
jgi:plasmid stability protein